MKAIETIYKGYRFRSRLEARWAVFFDALDIKWEYEKEGYEKNDNGVICSYLPDFYLPEFGMHVEVKGVMDERSARTLAHIVDWGSPLPFIDDSKLCKCDGDAIEAGANPYNFCPGILLLGDIPLLNHGFVIHKIIQQSKGIQVGYFSFLKFYKTRCFYDCELDLISSFTGDRYFSTHETNFDCYANSNKEFVEAFKPISIVVETKLANPKVAKAYLSARQARFEFGEKL
jgi:hypothetical protein